MCRTSLRTRCCQPLEDVLVKAHLDRTQPPLGFLPVVAYGLAGQASSIEADDDVVRGPPLARTSLLRCGRSERRPRSPEGATLRMTCLK